MSSILAYFREGVGLFFSPSVPSRLISAQEHVLYWMSFIALTTAIIAFGFWLRRKQAAFDKKSWCGLASAILLVALGSWVVPSVARVEQDESILQATSRGMLLRQSDAYALESAPSATGPQVLRWVIDKRPPMFPFIVSLVHGLTGGFDLSHAFWVNKAVFALLLWGVFGFIRKRLGITAGFSAQLSLLCTPLVLLCMSSSGFDLLASASQFACLALAVELVEEPSQESFLIFLGAGAFSFYVRYETFVTFLALLTLTLFMVRKRWRLNFVCISCLSLLLVGLFPLLVHNRFVFLEDAFLQTGGAPSFSLTYGMAHFPQLMREYFRESHGHAFSGALDGVGAAMLIFLGFKKNLSRIWLLVAATACASVLIACFYFFGDVTGVTSVRLFLIPAILGALGGSTLPFLLMKNRLWQYAFLAFVACVAGFELHSDPGSAPGRMQNTARLEQELDEVLPQFVVHRSEDLFVSPLSTYLLLKDFNAIAPATFEQYAPIFLNKNQVREIYLLATPVDEALAAQTVTAASIRARQRTELLLRVAPTPPALPFEIYRIIP